MSLTNEEEKHIIQLAEGVKQAETGMEKHFVNVCKGYGMPCTPKEKEWFACWQNYLLIKKKDKKAFDEDEVSPKMSEELKQLTDKGNVQELIDFGVNKKRDGELSVAKTAYKAAMSIDQTDPHIYHALAKVCYLMKEREESISNYLIATHLSIQNAKLIHSSSHESSLVIGDLIERIPKKLYRLISAFSPNAVYLLIDTNIARHLGPGRAGKMVLEWGKMYQSELLEMWNSQEFRKLPPLR